MEGDATSASISSLLAAHARCVNIRHRIGRWGGWYPPSRVCPTYTALPPMALDANRSDSDPHARKTPTPKHSSSSPPRTPHHKLCLTAKTHVRCCQHVHTHQRC
eukprot:3938140-Rhodomonas_salina.1